MSLTLFFSKAPKGSVCGICIEISRHGPHEVHLGNGATRWLWLVGLVTGLGWVVFQNWEDGC